jgi:BRCT domain type II-containing protein
VKPLDGLLLVCSGEFESIARKKLEDLIDSLGGTRRTAVSGKTDYLIVGYKMEDGREVTQGSKYNSAKKHGTIIFTEKQFEDFLREKSGNPNFTLSARKSLAVNKDEGPHKIRKSIEMQEGEFSHAMWTDLYKPTTFEDLVGN